jgi:hypothetical protein
MHLGQRRSFACLWRYDHRYGLICQRDQDIPTFHNQARNGATVSASMFASIMTVPVRARLALEGKLS